MFYVVPLSSLFSADLQNNLFTLYPIPEIYKPVVSFHLPSTTLFIMWFHNTSYPSNHNCNTPLK